MLRANRKRFIKLFVFLAILGILAWVGMKINPVEIIQQVGPGKVYVVLFFISLVSAVSTFTAAPFYLSVAVAITGGLDPIIVAAVVAPAIMIGDVVFLEVVENAVELVAQNSRWLARLGAWVDQQPQWGIYWGTFIFFGLIPISADMYLSILALANVKAKKIWPYILLGNFMFFILLGHLVQIGSPAIQKLLS